MKTSISPKEWEALSAYLDGQLTPKDRARLEARIKSEADLRSALDDLDRTRALIRNQSKLRAPRNFTLTPEMAGLRAGRRPGMGAYPVLRLASVLAPIFFVAVSVGNILTRSPQPTMLLAARSAATVAPAAPAAAVPSGLGGGGGGPVQGFALPAPTEAPVATMEAPAMAKSAAEPTTLHAEGVMVTPLTTPTPQPTPEGQPQAQLLDRSNVQEAAPQPGTAETAPVNSQPPPMLTTQTALGVLQVALAILAIGAGVGALLLRRSSR